MHTLCQRQKIAYKSHQNSSKFESTAITKLGTNRHEISASLQGRFEKALQNTRIIVCECPYTSSLGKQLMLLDATLTGSPAK